MVIQDRQKKFQEAIQRNPHLAAYLQKWSAEGNKLPEFYVQLQSDMAKMKEFNFLYPVQDPMFIHVYKLGTSGKRYITIEPMMTEETRAKYEQIQEAILKEAPYEKPHETREEFAQVLDRLMRKVTTQKESPVTGWLSSRLTGFETKKILVTPKEFETIKYYMIRNIIEHGPLEPIIRDPYIEDIHSIGTADLYIVHKVFGMMATNVRFRDAAELDEFLRTMSERIGKPVSDAKPIIDGALPDGSRINIVYSEDVSRKGSSFTIRKFSEKPFTVTALIKFGTLNTEIAAYIWLCLENGMSLIVSGETASGKTTTLNAILTFINHNHKVYSAEDTPEVIAPQPVWQRLITRDVGPEGSRVELFDLVRAALRSRPNYIIVGEVRGKEGSVMFQAMQTGHSVLSTFHAPSTKQLIQRFTGEPINVPIRFMDNLNVVVFQSSLYEGGRLIRRVISVDEIIRYSKDLDGVLTRSVFRWDPFTDTHFFRGMNNSFILEEKIAPRLKFEDKRMIYDELKARAKILKQMVDRNIVAYDDVNRIMASYYRAGGIEGLPPELRP
ncbi:MAG: type II/IV secretion system ATPase subunit [Thermoplasmata archaeon]